MRRHVKGCKHALTGRFHNHSRKCGNLLREKTRLSSCFIDQTFGQTAAVTRWPLIGETVINNVMIFLFRRLCHMFNWNVNK